MDSPQVTTSRRSLARHLAPYVPRWVRARLPLAAGTEETAPGASLYIHITGFTDLIRALVTRPDDAEQVRRIFDRIYMPLVAAIQAHGGDISRFAGPSLTAQFASRAAARAAAAALQRDLPAPIVTPSGVYPLGLRLGIGEGAVTWQIVGTARLGLYWVAHGPAVTQARAAAAPDAPALRLPAPGAATRGARPPAGRTGAAAALKPYVPPALVARLAAGGDEWIGEFRVVCTAFVALPAEGDLQTLVVAALPLIAQFGGRLNEIEIDGQERRLLLLFGAPVAYGDDAARAANCLLALREAGVLERAGMALGLQYVGTIGAPAAGRCTYTALSGERGVATRLLETAAPGEILVSGRVQAAAGPGFQCVPRGTLAGADRPAPVPVAELAGHAALDTAPAQETLQGRRAELAGAKAVMAAAGPGWPGLLRLLGDAGIGKTRLAAAIGARAATAGWRVLAGAARPDHQTTPYWPWLAPLYTLFGGTPLAPPDGPSLAATVTRLAPDRGDDAPLLGEVLGVRMAESPGLAALDPRTRAGATRTLLATLIGAAARQQPLLIWLDDLHWADSFSWDLVVDLTQGTPPPAGRIVVIIAHRPLGAHPPAALAALPHHTPLELHELDPEAAAALVRARAALPEPIVAQIVARGQGHPFFLEELVTAYVESGALVLPNTVQDVVQARIDRLPEPQQQTLKLASVLGRSFTLAALVGSYPPDQDAGAVPAHLHDLARLDLTPLDAATTPAYTFKHAITQEVAYSNLQGAARRASHERAAAWFEQTAPEDYALLVYHYGRSDNLNKQRVYLQLAAEEAQAAFGNDVAIDCYARLLSLLETTDQLPILLKLGSVWQLIGKWPEAEAVYLQAWQMAEALEDLHTTAQSQLALGSLMREKGSFLEALTWLEKARAAFTRLDDQAGLCQTIGKIGQVHWMQDSRPQAQACFEQQFEIASLLGDLRAMGQALGNLGNVLTDTGDTPRALACQEQHLAIAADLGDRVELERAYWGIASICHSLHDERRALDGYARTLQIAIEIGDKRTEYVALSGMGDAYLEYGDMVRALACTAHQLANALALGDRAGITPGIGNIATIYAQQGWFAESERLFRSAVAFSRTLATPYYTCVYLYQFAELYVRQERFGEAQTLNDEAARLAAAVEDKEFQFNTSLLAVHLRGVLRPAETALALAACSTLLETYPEDSQQAAIYFTMWRLDAGQEAARQQAAGIYERLYQAGPNGRYRERYEGLTGTLLPEPPPLPNLPEIVTRQYVDLPSLLVQVDALVEQQAGRARRHPPA
ncbi:MAG TPA: tetratricopeptide repeat protein [Chloroflexia bacterium]|nr:tetratricopeptide repeat protein [Chloroflexia bacterium]